MVVVLFSSSSSEVWVDALLSSPPVEFWVAAEALVAVEIPPSFVVILVAIVMSTSTVDFWVAVEALVAVEIAPSFVDFCTVILFVVREDVAVPWSLIVEDVPTY